MLKNSILNKLYQFGAHIGVLENTNQNLHNYISGKRNNFDIIDLNKTFILSKRALYFSENLSHRNGSVSYYYGDFYKLNIVYKCMFFTLAKNSNQDITTYKWVNGLINSYFFTYYEMIRDITLSWLHNAEYISPMGKHRNVYWANSKEKNQKREIVGNYRGMHAELSKPYILTEDKNVTKKDRKRLYILNRKNYLRKWYLRWFLRDDLASQRYNKFIKPLESSWKGFTFFKSFCMNDFKNIYLKRHYFKFKFLFAKMFYHIEDLKANKFESLNVDWRNFDTIQANKFNRRFSKYWRFILYFKHFKNLYNLPDALCIMCPDGNYSASNEFISCGLPSIAIVDTNVVSESHTYPIISNSSSMALAMFYFSLFSNTLISSKITIYHHIRNYSFINKK